MPNQMVSLNTAVSPYGSELTRIEEAKKLAQLMQQEGANPIQPYSYNGIQAPIAPTQGLAKLAKALLGKSMARDAETERKDLVTKAQSEADNWITSMAQADQPVQATAADVEDRQQGMDMGSGAAPMAVGEQLAGPMSKQERMALMLKGMQNPLTSTAAQSMLGNDQALERAKALKSLNAVQMIPADQVRQMGLPPGAYQRDANGKISMIGSSSGLPASPIQSWAKHQELVKQYGENSPQVRTFESFVRANQVINRGNQIDVVSGATAAPLANFGVGTKPQDSIDEKGNRIISTPGRPGGTPGMAQPAAPGAGQPVAPGGPTIQQLPHTMEQSRAASNAYSELNTKTGLVAQDIDRALGMADNWTVGAASVVSGIPGTPAHNLAALLNTIKANVGFDQLQAMRASSPTGGALGQVSERENILLQSVMGSLEQSQSPAQFKANLARLKEVLAGREARMKAAFDQDFGGRQPAQGPATPQPSAPSPGGGIKFLGFE